MKHVKILLCLLAALLLSGCGAKAELPDDPVVFELGTTEDYVYLSADGREYVPFCPMNPRLLGDCIGYCDSPAEDGEDGFRRYVFELKGYSSDEWIIETLALDNCNEGMILRERNATDIPEGLESEYEWNRLAS